jgi:hypothetical protein
MPPRIPKSKAVLLYHSFTLCWPNKIQEIEINKLVFDAYSQRWEEVLKEWMMKGYSPKNVGGMLSWFEKGIPELDKAINNYSHPGTPLKEL